MVQLYEQKQRTSVLELILWEAKIDDLSNVLGRVDSFQIMRGGMQARVHCGATIIIPKVLSFIPITVDEDDD